MNYIIAIGVIIGIMLLWVAVQTLWRNSFRDFINDEDVLAERRSCSNCGCTTLCQRKLDELKAQEIQ